MISEKRVKYFLVFLIAIVVIIGAAVRLTGLGTYQTHVDDVGVARTLLYPQMSYDPINKTINDINNPQYNSRVYAMGRIALGYLHYENNNYLIKIIIIPLCGTYAPLQFMSTALLISTAQTYRQILFWGRLPSAILGVLTLFLIILFYRKFPRPQKYYYMLASVALFAFSLESISYAKQMEHYGSGPFAIMMLLILLSIEINSYLKEERFNMRRSLLFAAILAVLCYLQYQVLFFVPPYYLTLMIVIYFRSKDIRGKGSFKNTIHQLKKAWRRIWRTYCLKIFIPAILFILLVIPLLLVAFRLSNSAVNWNAGPHNEFLLKIGANAPILEKISYFISFYSRNTFIVIASHLSPVTTDNLFYTLLAILFFIFFIFGLYRMLSSTEPLVRYIGIFIIGALLFFFAVVAIGKMTLSPTRHTLILMPFFIIPIAFGIVNTRLHFTKKHFAKKAGRQKTYSAILPIIAAVGLLLLFILNYASFSSQRIDPFSEKELEDTLATYNVSTLVAHSFTENILLMNGIIKEYNVFKDSEWVSTGKKDYNGRLLFISQRDSLNESVFTILKNRINARNGVSGQPIAGSWNDYEIIYSKEINSSVSIELSPLTKNGYNSLYIYVVALKREK